jgi:hypothetical protein
MSAPSRSSPDHLYIPWNWLAAHRVSTTTQIIRRIPEDFK